MQKKISRSKKMLIVGSISIPEEAADIECVAKSFIVAHRRKVLAQHQIPN
ncbi:MAG: hypothetical protein JXA75_06955 [Candidatus Thermoplasmatota archaeon]|nr:hypothetical protein [Candidatus Thermoplasmatota archaeon]